jgi:type IV pilus assembly protein PilO
MASVRFNPGVDLRGLAAQFRGLRGRHPGLWPTVPRVTLLAGLLAAVLALGWVGYWSGQFDELDAGVAREAKLKADYLDKLRQAVNLDALRKQRELVLAYVNQLEKQLPSKAEMDALLSDINQAGTGRGLQFELFKPGQVIVRDFYAELPIAIRLTGRFHDLAAFCSDVSNLARIVTLSDLQLRLDEGTGLVLLEATARTYRYLDAEEIAQARREAAKARQAARPGGAR